MKPKKTRRTNIARSLFIGVISVASVIGMASVGFAAWSFPATYESVSIKGDADGISIQQVDTPLGNFGVSVASSEASVEHYIYYVYEYVYLVDETTGELLYDEENDPEHQNPLQELRLVEHDTYGDLKIHSDLVVDLSYFSGQYDNINSIDYDDQTYTYLKVNIELWGNLILVSYKNSTLELANLPQYSIELEHKLATYLPITYSFYFPVKSTSKLSLYTLALTDTVQTNGQVHFNLDFTFDLSSTYENNTNYIQQIVLDYSIISQATYEEEIGV